MPIEVLRFGVGHRRPDGPQGTVGINGRVIHADARGSISELAFARGGRIEPHSNPNTTYLVIIEGGGWVAVGDEQLRVAAGEAVVWPAGEVHAAWTTHSEMRAFVVEFAGADESSTPEVVAGHARALAPGGDARAGRGEGALAPHDVDPGRIDRSEGEPL